MSIEMSSRTVPVNVAGRTALVVEDDPHLQKAMRKELARMDLHVLSASHYDGAVRHLATGEPNVICIDVGLPNKSGYELCEYIRGALGLVRTPILMTSEYGSPEDLSHAEHAGGNAFLHKPFSMQQLTDCVESLLNATRTSAPPMHELRQLAGNSQSAACAVNRSAEPQGLSAA